MRLRPRDAEGSSGIMFENIRPVTVSLRKVDSSRQLQKILIPNFLGRSAITRNSTENGTYVFALREVPDR